jgi:hypothetical protein
VRLTLNSGIVGTVVGTTDSHPHQSCSTLSTHPALCLPPCDLIAIRPSAVKGCLISLIGLQRIVHTWKDFATLKPQKINRSVLQLIADSARYTHLAWGFNHGISHGTTFRLASVRHLMDLAFCFCNGPDIFPEGR